MKRILPFPLLFKGKGRDRVKVRKESFETASRVLVYYTILLPLRGRWSKAPEGVILLTLCKLKQFHTSFYEGAKILTPQHIVSKKSKIDKLFNDIVV